MVEPPRRSVPKTAFGAALALVAEHSQQAAQCARLLAREWPDWPSQRDGQGGTLPMHLLRVAAGNPFATHLALALLDDMGRPPGVPPQAMRAHLATCDQAGRSLWPYLVRALTAGVCANASGVHLASCAALDGLRTAGLEVPPLDARGRGLLAQMESLGPCFPPARGFDRNGAIAAPQYPNLLRQPLFQSQGPTTAWTAACLAGWKGAATDMLADAASPEWHAAPRWRMSAPAVVLAAMDPLPAHHRAALPRTQREAFLNAVLMDVMLMHLPDLEYHPDTLARRLDPWLAPDVDVLPAVREALAEGYLQSRPPPQTSGYFRRAHAALVETLVRLDAMHAAARHASALSATDRAQPSRRRS